MKNGNVVASSAGHEEVPQAAAGFHTTHWTVVLAARDAQGLGAQEAIAKLCSTYWFPLYAFVRRQGSNPQEAEDFTQEFFLHFLDRNPLANVERAGGKFRSFLLVCLKNFLAHERERARAQRRGGGQILIPLEGGDAETRYLIDPADNLTPEALFDRNWAFALLERTMARVRQDYRERREEFDELEGFLPGGRGRTSRAELAARRGVSIGAIDVAVHRLRQRFKVLLKEEVAQTVASEAEIQDEIRYLISVVGL